ncbi:MAG: response regulator [Actinobacteria bacterium]|nr:response regulator [Actinomycetota bacterium]
MGIAEERGRSRILIIDDTPSNCLLLEMILEEEGFSDLRSISDPREAVSTYQEFKPDIILLDLHMPHMSGLEVIKALQAEIRQAYLPILMLTADVTEDAKLQALSLGAKEFLAKPFNAIEVVLRINNLLDTRNFYKRLQLQNDQLEERVVERSMQLEQAKVETLERLALAAELRDDATGQHTQRVGRVSALLAAALGLPDDKVELIRRAAPLHDIGKIATPDSILLKSGPLTPVEWEVMKRHTSDGGRLLSNSKDPALRLAHIIACTHHERWDGSGYAGTSGDDIPLEGRIVAVVDVFDALTHQRPYKEAWSLESAIAEITSQSGRQFDPFVVEAFLEVHARVDILRPPETSSHAMVDLSEAERVSQDLPA